VQTSHLQGRHQQQQQQQQHLQLQVHNLQGFNSRRSNQQEV
jgi:hypothetical protein